MNADLNDGMLLEAVRKAQDAHPIEMRLEEDRESFIRECLEKDRIPGWGLRAGETVESRMEKARHSRRDYWVWFWLHDTVRRLPNWRDKTPQELFWLFWNDTIECATIEVEDILDFVLRTGNPPQKDPFFPVWEDGYSFTSHNTSCAILSADFNFASLRKWEIDFDFQSYLFPLIRIYHAFDHENLLAEMPERIDSLITFHEAGKELKWLWGFKKGCKLAQWLKFLVRRIQKNFAMNFGFELAALYRGEAFSHVMEKMDGMGNRLQEMEARLRDTTVETGNTLANLIIDRKNEEFQKAFHILKEALAKEKDSLMREVMFAGVEAAFWPGWQSDFAKGKGKHRQEIQRKHRKARAKYPFYKSLEDGIKQKRAELRKNTSTPPADGRKVAPDRNGVDAEGGDGEEE